MQTTFIRFDAANYIPAVIVNTLEKLQDLYGVKEIARPTPFGIMVTCKNRRSEKKMLHALSYEMKAMKMEVIISPKQKRFNPYQ